MQDLDVPSQSITLLMRWNDATVVESSSHRSTWARQFPERPVGVSEMGNGRDRFGCVGNGGNIQMNKCISDTEPKTMRQLMDESGYLNTENHVNRMFKDGLLVRVKNSQGRWAYLPNLKKVAASTSSVAKAGAAATAARPKIPGAGPRPPADDVQYPLQPAGMRDPVLTSYPAANA